VKDRGDVQRRLDVLTEFFNKKEAELQKQLGLQSAKFGDVSTDAESTARQLLSVTSEQQSRDTQVKLLKTELDDQEKSLKAEVASQEKKAHENWVAARQAERKLAELQSELSVLRNNLTMSESRASLLEQEKTDLTGTVSALQQHVKPEPQGQGERELSSPPSESSLHNASSPGPSSLPPLPGLPGLPGMEQGLPSLPSMPSMPMATMPGMPGMPLGMPMAGMMPPMASNIFPSMGIMPLDTRPPPIGRMSPPTDRGNRSYTDRSPSPEYDRYRRRDSYRDSSPSSRSERRLSPRRPSPTRSERGYRERREYSDYRDRDRDRYYTNGRDGSPDRYSDRSQRSERGSMGRYAEGGPPASSRYPEDRERGSAAGSRTDYLKSPQPGPKTSSPMDPQGVRNYGGGGV